MTTNAVTTSSEPAERPEGRRTYVITGASSGIGLAVSRRLQARDETVIGIDLHDADVIADLADPGGRAGMIDAVARLTGGMIDAVIACAGVGGGIGDPAPVIAVNYFGAVATLDGLRPLLARADRPRAVVVASIGVTAAVDQDVVAACLAGDEQAAIDAARERPELAYTSTKRAIARWMRAHAPLAEWAGAGIPLNAVGPGLVETPMTAGLLADPEMRSRLYKQMPMPLGWPAAPSDIAPALDWLSSADNTMITGQCLFVDGGLEAVRRGDDIW
jgi:NAD(P)-dependent dehydrogenase (short-subunit alcohol dehydrogenase family)